MNSSSRLPAELLYFVIYNPTLKPAGPVQPDDEDAEEQAHVLFYTAKNHAVSKDRVLRQVGLAKAISNFTTIFETQSPCESIHSAGRRMLMVSPEAEFWFHACFELERNPRPPRKDSKGKSAKGKEKEVIYDANESSLHDKALRARLLMGYEAFRLTHGSFTNVFEELGREALELQLERFFTVWAWNWDVGKTVPFPDYLGPRVHPLSNQLRSLLETFEDKLPLHYHCIALIGSCVIGPQNVPEECPVALVRHFLHLLQTRLRSQPPSRGDFALLGHGNAPSGKRDSGKHSRVPSKLFLGIPMQPVSTAMNATVNVMDVRKWTWPGSLSFNMGGPSNDEVKKTRSNEESDNATISQSAKEVQASPGQPILDIPIDTQSLADALSSESIHQGPEASDVVHPQAVTHTPPATASSLPLEGCERQSLSAREQPVQSEREDVVSTPPFTETYLHFTHTQPWHTRRRLVRYLTKSDVLLAVIPSQTSETDELEDSICNSLEEKGAVLIDRLKAITDQEEQKIATAFASSPVQNVLQKSQHAISIGERLTHSSSNFSASSWHLHEGKQTLDVDKEVLEVYSRSQNPQDWHLSRRVNDRTGGEDCVFMEIGRKEASLVDVEGEVAGVLRRYAE